MDSQLVNKLAAAYAGRTLRLTPTQFDALGLIKKGMQLLIEEFHLSCIPFDIALGRASFLSFLSEKEVSFFEGFKDKPHKFFMSCRTPYSKKPENFYIPCRIVAFRKPETSPQYCFIDVIFQNVPLVFQEMLVRYFIESDEAELFFKEAPDADFSADQIRAALGSMHVKLTHDGDVPSERLKVVNLRPRYIKVFGEFEGELPAAKELLEFENDDETPAWTLKGECIACTPFADANGFAFIEAALSFDPIVASRLKHAAGWKSKPNTTK